MHKEEKGTRICRVPCTTALTNKSGMCEGAELVKGAELVRAGSPLTWISKTNFFATTPYLLEV